jgi:hypothetical protein
MTPKAFEAICSKGQKADRLYSQGRFNEAQKAYTALLGEMEHASQIDSYLIGKVTLGVILCHIKTGQLQKAITVWNSTLEDSLFGIGIYGLENAQTSLPDMLTYDFVCAYLHSVADATPDESGHAVTQYMSRVCEHAIEAGNRDLCRMALNNWKQHLREIFTTSIPFAFAKPLIEFERAFGTQVKLGSLEFPELHDWSKPHDFHEVSYVVQFRKRAV